MFDDGISIILTILLIFCVWLLRLWLQSTHKNLFIYHKKNHSWKHKAGDEATYYCNVCENLCHLNLASVCEFCLICVDKSNCLKVADKTIQCKKWANKSEKTFYHIWSKGNIPNNSNCTLCEQDIHYHGEIGLKGVRCIWCKRHYHDLCFENGELKKDEICDLGKYKEFIVPPYIVKAPKNKMENAQIISKPSWMKPLFIIGNTKSGSNEAEEIISGFRSILNSMQIFQLDSRVGPKPILEFIAKFQTECRLLVAGGDGTVGWILSTIQEIGLEIQPEVCIIPTGTGNDLSRILGWGSETDTDIEPYHFLEKIKAATPVKIDRWLVEINYEIRLLSRNFHKNRRIFMYNYFSLGVDSLITLNFHRARESKFYIFSHRLFNKLLYFVYGTHQVMTNECNEIEKSIELFIDGSKVELPELQSVVFLNIDSWGAGVQLWKIANKNKNPTEIMSFNDGKLEVFGISSSFHIAQLQVGMSMPIELGKANEVKLRIKEKLPIQIDGEPFWISKKHSPSDITIKKHSQATVLTTC